ncbi:MAG TPA: hypothetical protein VHP33_28120 [Polyangiaceae bacterium]|nr:hypothetical protein [Polyangiaceae bacterium]
MRGAAWGGSAGLAINELFHMQRQIRLLEMSAPQQAGFAATVAVELLTLYILTRALDTVLELRERGILEKKARTAPLPPAPV